MSKQQRTRNTRAQQHTRTTARTYSSTHTQAHAHMHAPRTHASTHAGTHASAQSRTHAHAHKRTQEHAIRHPARAYIDAACCVCARACVLLACTCNMPSMLAFEKNLTCLRVSSRVRACACTYHTHKYTRVLHKPSGAEISAFAPSAASIESRASVCDTPCAILD